MSLKIYSYKVGRQVEWIAENQYEEVVASDKRELLGDYKLHDLEAIYRLLCKIDKQSAYKQSDGERKLYILAYKDIYKLLTKAKKDVKYMDIVEKIHNLINYSAVCVEVILCNTQIRKLNSKAKDIDGYNVRILLNN